MLIPVTGEIEVEIEGRGVWLDCGAGALFAAGARHCQAARGDNRAIIVNLMADHAAPEGLFGRLEEHGRFEVTPAIRHLIAFLVEAEREGRDLSLLIPMWISLLTAALREPAPVDASASRLPRLLAMIAETPGADFSVARMSGLLGVSPSRLHVLFQAELGRSPHSYIVEMRMRRAVEILSTTSRPIIDVAMEVGFNDQSAFTRAMRRLTGITPAAFRRGRGYMAQYPGVSGKTLPPEDNKIVPRKISLAKY